MSDPRDSVPYRAVPHRRRMRELLDHVLPTDADLEAFCGDYFPNVRRDRFTLGMDRVQKLTLLLDHVKAGELMDALRQQYPEAVLELEQAEVAARGMGGPAPARLVHVPELPPHFLDRDLDMASLKKLVLGPPHTAVAVTGRALRTGVQGMGGIGKTVLAARLTYDDEIRCAFPDGIFWITLGQTPLMTQRQAELCTALGEPGRAFQDTQQGQARLTELMANRACLVILDDAWQLDHVAAMGRPGSGGRVLFTTRDASIVAGLGASAHCVDKLSDEQAMRLLANWSGQPLEGLPPEARAVAKECGHLPLALAMIGASVHGAPDGWTDALEKLRAADLSAIAQQLPDYPYPDLLRAIQVSIDALPASARPRYLDLAVFPEDTPIPKTVLETFWKTIGLKEYQTRDVLNLLSSRSLLRRDEEGHFLLHDLQRDYLIHDVKDLPGLHGRLLEAYAGCCPGGWASGPHDGYFFLHVAYHLAGAGRLDELRRMLLDFAWLRAKLQATDPASVLADFAWLPRKDALASVEGTIRLSGHILAEDKEQLASQLIGRLSGEVDSDILALVAQVPTSQRGPWLRLLGGSLTPPGGPLLRTLSGHSQRVGAVAVTADGRWAVSGSDDATLRLWDLHTGRELRSLSGHSGAIHAVSITPDGRWAISGSADRTIKLWDLCTGRERRTLSGHLHRVNAVVIMPDGRSAISGSDDHCLKKWDLKTGRVVRSFSGHSDWVRAVAVTPDGRLTVSGSDDRTVRVWDVETGRETCTLSGHSDWVRAIAVTADGRLAVSGSADCTLKVWDLQSRRLLRTLFGHSDSVATVAVSADGRSAVSGGNDRTIKVWDIQSGQELRSLSGHSRAVTSVVATADGRCAVSASGDHTLKVWDLKSEGKARSVSGHERLITAVAVTADGCCALSGSQDTTLKLWDLKTGQELCTFLGHSRAVTSVAISPDGRWAVSGSDDTTVKVWDLQAGRELRTLSGHSAEVYAVAMTADGRFAVSGSIDRTLRVWDLVWVRESRSFSGHSDWVRAVAISADGHWAVSGSNDRTLRVWDLQSGACVHSLAGHSDLVRAVALSADGRWAVSGSFDRTVRVWDLQSGQHVRSFLGHCGGVSAVAVTADGRWVISGSYDRTVKVWDLQTGSVLATFTADYLIYALAVAADSRSIVAGDSQGMVHFLRLEGM